MEAVNQKSITVEKMTSICNPMHDNPIQCLEVAQMRTIRQVTAKCEPGFGSRSGSDRGRIS